MDNMYLVFGGELKDLTGEIAFKDPDHLDVVGVFIDYEKANKAWLEKARATIDIAQMRYFLIELKIPTS